ncbi:RelE toxin of RelEB toxin-antitoxin system [Mucilaginibacter gracilis]|uniref:RelE toxin of RelEB toxin-antitoxin system n=1 Tax=Mucilaginibacter gracilis TaxID=423350 RepID=A0A495IZP1_9SPHI|nr:type II toxin-antitoxin system RelE/ParE family toxin [Mucilaginibacter gracilis]RKR81983.1 RelE toxin of RelEB toxin-antitoxin system [Mucilaginibacter gracilis]
MSYNVITIEPFDKDLKRLIKKYPSLKQEITNLFNLLETDPTAGTPMGKGCYKIRLAIASKGKGKSGGARVITHCAVVETTVLLLSIYDKSEQADISDKELQKLLDSI